MSKLSPDTRRVVKVSYKAVDMIASVIAGLFVSLIFNRAWRVIRRRDAPKPTDERRSWWVILLAAGLQGAIFALIRAATGRGIAMGTRKLTGIWPGDEGQPPEDSA